MVFNSSILFLFLLVGAALLSFFIVQQQSISIIERFGKFNRIADAGLNFKIPLIDRVAGEMSLRIRQIDVHVETKTQDNVFVQIIISVQYQASPGKIYEAFYMLHNPYEQVKAYVFDVVRAQVPNITIDDLFAKKDEIAINVKNELHDTMQNFGYEIIKALVTDIQPNENVKQAMNEINTAQRMRVAAQERGEAEKIVRIKQAEAEAEANILHGKGIAGQRKAIVEGLSKSIEEMQHTTKDLDGKAIMQMILMIQYFDTLRELGASSKSSTIFVNNSPSGMSDIAQEIRNIMFAAKENND